MTNAPASPLSRLSDTLNALLDRDYARFVRPALHMLMSDPRIKRALDVLRAEAARLESSDARFTPDNPALAHVRDNLDRALSRQTLRLDSAGVSLEATAVATAALAARQLALPGVSDQHLATLGIQWNRPDPQAIQRLVDTSNSAAWADALDKFGPNVAERVNRYALSGILEGRNPRQTAKDVSDAISAMPRAEAEKMLRTLQLTSYRQATAANYAANDDIIEYAIRYEALDDRTCLSCIALHGTRLEIDEVPDEHWNGRAVAVPVVKGFERDVQSGEDWLNAQSEDRQRAIMGDAAYNAWNAGAIDLSDFVEHTTDPIFGSMIQEASLKGILGEKARKYYAYAN